MRPTIEYCNPVWGPSFILNQRRIEKIQCRATRLLPRIREKPYQERFLILNLPSLAHRHHRGDIIWLYEILNGYFNSDFSTLCTYFNTTITRGHHFKLFKHWSRLYCIIIFFIWVINDQNSLPALVVRADSVNSSRFTFVTMMLIFV